MLLLMTYQRAFLLIIAIQGVWFVTSRWLNHMAFRPHADAIGHHGQASEAVAELFTKSLGVTVRSQGGRPWLPWLLGRFRMEMLHRFCPRFRGFLAGALELVGGLEHLLFSHISVETMYWLNMTG